MKVPVMRDAHQSEGLRQLCVWANQHGCDNKAVEIGAYSGEGTIVLAKHFKEVLAVDPWLNGYDIGDVASQQCPMKFVFAKFQENTKDLNNVNYSQGKSLDALDFINTESLDLVYVDGDHRYEAAVADLKGWLPKLRKGGVMAGHDWSFKAVQAALSEVFGHKEITLFQGDSWALIP
jgi:predicted O-methyltransferase YrrM